MSAGEKATRFKEWVRENPLPTGQIALCYTLIFSNYKGDYSWFSISNQELCKLTGLSDRGLKKARKGLEEKGLIEYIKGRSNKPGSYLMLCVHEKVPTGERFVYNIVPTEEKDKALVPEKVPTGTIQDNSEPKIVPSQEKPNVFGASAKQFKAMLGS